MQEFGMRKLVIALGALAVVGFTAPVVSSASAETVVIKRGHNGHGWHRGWERRHVMRDRYRHHGHRTVVIHRR
jgi:hypothetical protein